MLTEYQRLHNCTQSNGFYNSLYDIEILDFPRPKLEPSSFIQSGRYLYHLPTLQVELITYISQVDRENESVLLLLLYS